MFKVNHLFGGNGALPSLGGGTTSLASALAGVERAEAALAAARALARSAAKREGVAVRGLFEDLDFILRETGERWADEARAEGRDAALWEIDPVAAADRDPKFRHLVARLRRPGALQAQQEAISGLTKAEQILAAAARARSSGENERPEPTGVAAQVIAAGKKARRPTGSDNE